LQGRSSQTGILLSGGLDSATTLDRGFRLGHSAGHSPDDGGRACGVCDACRIRKTGFEAAGTADSTRYTRS
jgi:7-cyano-7-deazaguanine synthase